MNRHAFTILCVALTGLVSFTTLSAIGQEEPKAVPRAESGLLEVGSWWNLYFEKENDQLARPGRSINAVKVVAVDAKRPSWIQISYPKSNDEHFSIFAPAAKASKDDSISIEEALAAWEKTVSEWTTTWVNLDYVVRMSKVGE